MNFHDATVVDLATRGEASQCSNRRRGLREITDLIIDSRKRIARTAIAPKLRPNPYCTQFADYFTLNFGCGTVMGCYENRSTMMTSNRPIEE